MRCATACLFSLRSLSYPTQALNVAADASLAATNVRALFVDWLAKFERAYRAGDEVRRPIRACSLRSGNADALDPCPLAAAFGSGV